MSLSSPAALAINHVGVTVPWPQPGQLKPRTLVPRPDRSAG